MYICGGAHDEHNGEHSAHNGAHNGAHGAQTFSKSMQEHAPIISASLWIEYVCTTLNKRLKNSSHKKCVLLL